jgi:hypothetical protein
MIHDTNLNKIAYIDWSQVFIMPKRVFYDLSYATIMSNVIKETKKSYLTTSSQPYDSMN